jgi:hypothetical protein
MELVAGFCQLLTEMGVLFLEECVRGLVLVSDEVGGGDVLVHVCRKLFIFGFIVVVLLERTLL